MKKFKKLFCLLISCILLLSATGCGEKGSQNNLDPNETPDVYYFERFGDEVMPIGGYLGPTLGFGHNGNYYPSQITNEHYAQVADCGINFIIGTRPSYSVNSQAVLDALRYADQNDVMYFVLDNYLYQVNDNNAKDESSYLYVDKDEFAERVKAYSNYDSFAGLYLRDEPFAKHFDQCAAIMDVFYEVFEGTDKQVYLNSNSFQCPDGWFGGGSEGTAEEKEMTIEEYMTEWFEKFGLLGYYSYDTYPFTGKGDNIRADILENYSLVRRFCEEYDKPF